MLLGRAAAGPGISRSHAQQAESNPRSLTAPLPSAAALPSPRRAGRWPPEPRRCRKFALVSRLWQRQCAASRAVSANRCGRRLMPEPELTAINAHAIDRWDWGDTLWRTGRTASPRVPRAVARACSARRSGVEVMAGEMVGHSEGASMGFEAPGLGDASPVEHPNSAGRRRHRRTAGGGTRLRCSRPGRPARRPAGRARRARCSRRPGASSRSAPAASP